jgi:hypothetical protein
LAVLGLLAVPGVARAAVVDSLGDAAADSGAQMACQNGTAGCTLRAAVEIDATSITFTPGLTGAIPIASTLPIDTALTAVNGVGASVTLQPAAGAFNISASDVTLENLTISGGAGSAIGVTGGAARAIISGNTISGGTTGVQVDSGTSASLSANTIGGVGTGVSVGGSASVSGGSINSAATGIAVTGAGVATLSSSISSLSGSGVSVPGGGTATITSGVISGGTGSGDAAVATSGDTTISGAVLQGSATGLAVGGTSTAISGSTVQSNTNGIAVTGGAATITNDTIINNTTGIVVASGTATIGGNSTAVDNLINSNTDDGIRSTGGTVFLLQNRGTNGTGGNDLFFDIGGDGPTSAGRPAITFANATEVTGTAPIGSTVRVYVATPSARGLQSFIGTTTADSSGNWLLLYSVPDGTRLAVNVSTASGTNSSEYTFGVADAAGPPNTAILGGPPALTSDNTPTFSFSGGGSGLTYQCKVDGGAFAACSSPVTLSKLSDGTHTFSVRSRDFGGILDPNPATRTFRVDATAPDTSINTAPPGLTNDATPRFRFGSEPGASLECKVDGSALTPCTSPRTLKRLSDGKHSFEVRARDAAGNIDPSPALRNFTVDTDVPLVSLTRTARLAKRRLKVTITCAKGRESCRGTLVLRRGKTSLKTDPFALKPRKSRNLTFKLSAKTVRAVMRRRRPSIIVVATTRDTAGNKATLTRTLRLR